MHVTTKDIDSNGTHILTSVLEGDGPNPIASDAAKLSAKVISVQRTPSGGVQVQTALSISEPAPVQAAEPEAAKPEPTPEEKALAYLKSKGLSAKEADAAVKKFGPTQVLIKQQQELKAELDSLVSSGDGKNWGNASKQ